MACLIGIVLSKPLEIRIMKSEIDSALHTLQAEKFEDLRKTDTNKRDEQFKIIAQAKQELEAQAAKKSQELANLTLKRDNADEAFRKEFEGTGGTGKQGVGKAAIEKKSLMEQRKAEYEAGQARLQPEIDQFAARIKAKTLEEDKAVKIYEDAEPDAKRKSEQLNGLIKRIEIAKDISPYATWFLTFMLIFIEVTPLIFKMMITLSPIDYLTENQKRLTLVRRGIQMSHDLDSDGKYVQDVKKATYHQVELEQLQVVGKIDIDHELTAAVQQKFKTEVAADIEQNPSRYIERVQPTEPKAT
jgi:hypothetical protein